MTVIGLTGGIASGKSTAAEYLRQLGATLIDADRVGHRSYEPGTPGFEKVVNAFGHDIVGKDGLVDRRILGGKVFGAPGEMERLNAILWPEIRRLIGEELRDLRRKDKDQIIVLEAAVLIEAGWTDLCDEIWVVTTTQPIAIQRLMVRNGLTQEAALARINSQMSTADRAAYGNVKVDNSGTEEQMQQRLDRAWRVLTKRLDDERGVKTPTRLPAKLAAKPVVRPTAKAVAKTAAKNAATAPAGKVAAKPAGKPAAKAPVSKVAAKPAAKSAAKAPVAKARPVAKPAARPSRPAAKPTATSSKAVARPAAKATKAAAKPAAKAAKPAPKAIAKVSKAPVRASSKAAAKPAAAARRR